MRTLISEVVVTVLGMLLFGLSSQHSMMSSVTALYRLACEQRGDGHAPTAPAKTRRFVTWSLAFHRRIVTQP